jgi:hypothetical protein
VRSKQVKEGKKKERKRAVCVNLGMKPIVRMKRIKEEQKCGFSTSKRQTGNKYRK